MFGRTLIATWALCILGVALAARPAAGLFGSRSGSTDGDLPPGGLPLDGTNQPWIELLSWKPRSFLYHNFMSEEEADHIIAQAKPWMARSTVVGENGSYVLDSVRTSYGSFLARLHDPILERVQRRVAAWTKINITHQEDMQILRYGQGQKYGAHYDSLIKDTPRVATVLLYFSTPGEGGETAFPQGSQWLDESLKERLGPFSECTRGGVAARPKKGDAFLFYSIQPDGSTQDPASLHTGCPVISGVKWTGTIWIHSAPFRPESFGKPIWRPSVPPEDCGNSEERCEEWAAAGECQANPVYMKGDGAALGACRLACGECEKCEGSAAEVRACQSRNRVRAGFLSMEELEADL